MNKIYLSIRFSSLILLVSFSSSFATQSQEQLIDTDLTFYDAKQILLANPTDKYPTELWTLRSPELGFYDLARQVKQLAKHKDTLLSEYPQQYTNIIDQRLNQMVDVADRALAMEADSWNQDYSDSLNQHMINLRKTGISDLFPKELDSMHCSDIFIAPNAVPCDPLGIPFGTLRPVSSKTSNNYLINQLSQYMQDHGADYKVIENWRADQVVSSFSVLSNEVKLYYQKQRTIPLEDYDWKHPINTCPSQKLDAFSNDYNQNEKNYSAAFPIWHAYVQEFLRNTEFQNNNLETNTVCLTRFENLSAFIDSDITRFASNYRIRKPVYESSTAFTPFEKINAPITVQKIPYWRILDSYLLSTGFIDRETEFVIITGPDSEFSFVDYFGGSPFTLNKYDYKLIDKSNIYYTELMQQDAWCAQVQDPTFYKPTLVDESRSKKQYSLEEWLLVTDNIPVYYISTENSNVRMSLSSTDIYNPVDEFNKLPQSYNQTGFIGYYDGAEKINIFYEDNLLVSFNLNKNVPLGYNELKVNLNDEIYKVHFILEEKSNPRLFEFSSVAVEKEPKISPIDEPLTTSNSSPLPSPLAVPIYMNISSTIGIPEGLTYELIGGLAYDYQPVAQDHKGTIFLGFGFSSSAILLKYNNQVIAQFPLEPTFSYQESQPYFDYNEKPYSVESYFREFPNDEAIGLELLINCLSTYNNFKMPDDTDDTVDLSVYTPIYTNIKTKKNIAVRMSGGGTYFVDPSKIYNDQSLKDNLPENCIGHATDFTFINVSLDKLNLAEFRIKDGFCEKFEYTENDELKALEVNVTRTNKEGEPIYLITVDERTIDQDASPVTELNTVESLFMDDEGSHNENCSLVTPWGHPVSLEVTNYTKNLSLNVEIMNCPRSYNNDEGRSRKELLTPIDTVSGYAAEGTFFVLRNGDEEICTVEFNSDFSMQHSEHEYNVDNKSYKIDMLYMKWYSGRRHEIEFIIKDNT